MKMPTDLTKRSTKDLELKAARLGRRIYLRAAKGKRPTEGEQRDYAAVCRKLQRREAQAA